MTGQNDHNDWGSGPMREVDWVVSRGVRSPGFSAAALRNALARESLTAEDLADSIGVSRQAVSSWLTGKTTPSPTSLVRAAEILNLSPADLTPHVAAANIHLADLRVRAGLTQAQFAAKLGMPASTLSDIERGRSRYDDLIASRMAAILELSEGEVASAWEQAVADRTRSREQADAARRRRK